MSVSRTALSPRRPAPAPERSRHLEVVRTPPVPGRRPPVIWVALVVIATGAALFSLVFANVLLGQAGFDQSDLERRVDAKRLEVEQAQIDVEALRSPERVYRRALQIGMVPANDVAVILSTRSGPSPVRGGRP